MFHYCSDLFSPELSDCNISYLNLCVCFSRSSSVIISNLIGIRQFSCFSCVFSNFDCSAQYGYEFCVVGKLTELQCAIALSVKF